ncbi:hypothetical protein H4R20_002931, partial [Coemansia guatemalensis]
MVRFSLRSVAFMALSFVAAASPLAQGIAQPAAPAALTAPEAVNAHVPAAQAIVNDNRNHAAPNMMVPQQQAGAKPEECVMVPCSEEECLRNMTPQEQVDFRRQCEEMRSAELQKATASGKSRVAKDAGQLTYYKMLTPQEAAAQKVSGGKPAFITPIDANGKAVGNRPNGKNL